MKKNYNDYMDEMINESDYKQSVRIFGKEQADMLYAQKQKDRKIGEIMVIIQVIAYIWLVIYFK